MRQLNLSGISSQIKKLLSSQYMNIPQCFKAITGVALDKYLTYSKTPSITVSAINNELEIIDNEAEIQKAIGNKKYSIGDMQKILNTIFLLKEQKNDKKR